MRSKTTMICSSSLPVGVSDTFEPKKGIFEETKVFITVTKEASKGELDIILNAEMNYIKKGTIVTFHIL